MKDSRLVAAIAYRHRLLDQLPRLEGELVARLQHSGSIKTRRFLAQRNGTGYQILTNIGDNTFVQLKLFVKEAR